ncbi:MAG: hypothetical protein AAFN10_21115 [Bacteroidota bacterium]
MLSQLNETEERAFLHFLASPYFNRQERLLHLAEYLCQHPADTWQHEQLHQQLYRSAEPYRKQAVYDALSQLQRLLERFLSLQSFEANPHLQQSMLLQSLAKIQAEDAFQRQWQKAQKKWQDYAFQDLSYFEGQYDLHRQASLFEATQQRRTQDDYLHKTVEYLDRSYWSARLKYACEILNRSHILKKSPEEEAIKPNIIAYLPPHLAAERSIKAYLLIYKALSELQNTEHYHTWINWLSEHSQYFGPEEAADMYNYAQNYCVRKVNQGDASYLRNLFDLFTQLTEKELLLDKNGFIDHRKLKNMVTVGLRLQAFDWVDRFLHDHQEKMLPSYREDAFRFNLASLRYAQGRHSEALRLLQQVDFKDVFYLLSAKSLLLKIYFETDEDMALEFQLENFRLFLARNRLVSSFQRNVHLNLLRFTRKLYRLREQKGMISKDAFAERLLKLETQLRAAADVANASWLYSQIKILQAGD